MIRIGGNDYAAEVVVGTRKDNSMLLLDVLNLLPASFIKKETVAATSANPSPEAARSTATISSNNIANPATKSQAQNNQKRSSVPVELDSTGLKSVENLNPTENEDIRYSITPDFEKAFTEWYTKNAAPIDLTEEQAARKAKGILNAVKSDTFNADLAKESQKSRILYNGKSTGNCDF